MVLVFALSAQLKVRLAGPPLGALLLLVAACGSAESPGPKKSPRPGASPATNQLDPLAPPSRLAGLTAQQLGAQLGQGPGKQRDQTLARILGAARGDAPLLHRALHRPDTIPTADLKNVLRAVGAAVPDRNGRFSGPAPKRGLDWLAALSGLDRSKLSAGLRQALDQSLLDVALIRGLARTGHADAAVSLVRFGYRHGGAFRDECGRQLRSMGISAVPGLLRVRALRDREAFKMVRYAQYQLDRMDFNRPRRCLAKATPELRAELLHAYGEVRDPIAVRATLKYANHRDARVRRAARWAILRYVSGRKPRVVKRKLKLTGGRHSERERALYLTYRQLAAHALSDELTQRLLRPGQEPKELKRSLLSDNEPRHLAERLFAIMDRQRSKARSKEISQALALGNEGKLAAALAQFDAQLAADPTHPSAAEMAPFYYRRGVKLLDSGRLAQAHLHLTKAMHLRPDAAFVKAARARCELVEALMTKDHDSPVVRWKLQTALTLDPSLVHARQALNKQRKRGQQRMFMVGGVGGGVVLSMLLGMVLLWRRLSP